MTVKTVLCSAGVFMDPGRQHTGVINNINNGSIPFSITVMSMTESAQYHRPGAISPNWNVAIINVMNSTCASSAFDKLKCLPWKVCMVCDLEYEWLYVWNSVTDCQLVQGVSADRPAGANSSPLQPWRRSMYGLIFIKTQVELIHHGNNKDPIPHF